MFADGGNAPNPGQVKIQFPAHSVLSNRTEFITSLLRLSIIITAIGHSFLWGCQALQAIDLSPLSNVEFIAEGFMGDCTSLRAIDFSPLERSLTEGHVYNWLRDCESLEGDIDLTPLRHMKLFQITELLLYPCFLLGRRKAGRLLLPAENPELIAAVNVSLKKGLAIMLRSNKDLSGHEKMDVIKIVGSGPGSSPSIAQQRRIMDSLHLSKSNQSSSPEGTTADDDDTESESHDNSDSSTEMKKRRNKKTTIRRRSRETRDRSRSLAGG